MSDEPETNPIVDSGADPWVVRLDGAYSYCFSRRRAIWVRRSETLAGIGRGPATAVWSAPAEGPCSQDLWAPELHRIGDRCYIYFAADDGENANHRMFVLESDGPDPIGPYRLRGKVAAPSDRWAIDGTVGRLGGHDYFVWSGWPGAENVVQALYIAAMSDPGTLIGDRVCIAEPDRPWERVGPAWAGEDTPGGVLEGPQFLEKDGAVHLIYSANGSWTDDYCLGRLTYDGGPPLDPSSWHKADAPVFAGTPEVVAPGHACFVSSPEDGHDWIVYHAAKRRGAGWDRHVRAQRFSWEADGAPRFGRPIPTGVPIDADPEAPPGQ